MSRDEPSAEALATAIATVFDRDFVVQVYNYVTDMEGREKSAETRSVALLRAHQAGWKGVADAIRAGLGDIADALRERP
jgi:flagellar biosynthesis regulator FlaF